MSFYPGIKQKKKYDYASNQIQCLWHCALCIKLSIMNYALCIVHCELCIVH